MARIVAVQALYQRELTEAETEALIEEFITHRLTAPLGEETTADADYFAGIVRGVSTAQEQIDDTITATLPPQWALLRLDSTLRALLRAGCFELLLYKQAPPKALVADYVDMAHAFFEEETAGMANAILDKIAKENA